MYRSIWVQSLNRNLNNNIFFLYKKLYYKNLIKGPHNWKMCGSLASMKQPSTIQSKSKQLLWYTFCVGLSLEKGWFYSTSFWLLSQQLHYFSPLHYIKNVHIIIIIIYFIIIVFFSHSLTRLLSLNSKTFLPIFSNIPLFDISLFDLLIIA